MSCWAEKYIGLPSDKSLSRNCLGYVSRMLRDEYGKHFPNFLGAMRAAMNGTPLPARQTRALRDGAMIIGGNTLNPMRHVGVYCREADRVIHADPDVGEVLAYPMWRLRLEWPTVTYWKVVA